MAFCIRAQLSRINEIIAAIDAQAQSAMEQAGPYDNIPPWAITLELLANLAKDELEVVHNSLQRHLNGGGENAPT